MRQKPIARYRSKATQETRKAIRLYRIDLMLETMEGKRSDYKPKQKLLAEKTQLLSS